ncbi:hypothetical protein BJY16_007099 [Actinoplanes octamycinicus]|uniref:DUF3817 domain-containing protein n=1 Tax=Actinoplanes octamycinicus TaxID=135948 RepID=A0A7W7MBA6_9ACTN|nr:DUF3817 domain-containing protein [Actinoplanes octamycinicus]MBB4743640.1 hypothetical protein [Actinoplanes octamycinicus]GIE61065.1 hypothetical protein Aoc01nite_64670 [Actinoplanes octamycinicus]
MPLPDPAVRPSRRPLEIAALIELASLAVLLLNLVTAHLKPITSLGGPIHGCAYLFVVILTATNTAARTARLLALVPGIGGLLALRHDSVDRGRAGADRAGGN